MELNNAAPALAPAPAFNTIPHSVQIYWYTTASTIDDVKEELIRNNQLDDETIIAANNAAATARECASLFWFVIRERHDDRGPTAAENNYTNSEIVFYNQLTMLLMHDDFRTHLQNMVLDEVALGTRYFEYFLRTIGVNTY